MKEFNDDFNLVVSPIKYIELMYENTNQKGVLYIPGWSYMNEPEYSLRCKINWNQNDLENVIFEFKDLQRKIEKIAKIYEKAEDGDFEYFKRLLNDEDLYPIWKTYFQPFEYKKTSQKAIDDIVDKIETVKTVKNLEHKMWSEEQIESYERNLYEEYKDLKVTKEESDIYSDYCHAFYDYCEEKVGTGIGAVDLVLRARRLCKLLEIDAPKMIVDKEACMLAVAYVIHKYAYTMEKVDDSARTSNEKLNFLTEEEEEEYIDSLCRPKKRNNRKQMLSLFVYRILKTYSTSNKHMSQQEIIDVLKEMPYELSIERKALSRVLHGLEDEMVGVHTDPREGSWYDPSDDGWYLDD